MLEVDNLTFKAQTVEIPKLSLVERVLSGHNQSDVSSGNDTNNEALITSHMGIRDKSKNA